MYTLLFLYSSASHCGIEVLTKDALIAMNRLAIISLDHNKIKRVEARTFRGMYLLDIV